MIIAIIILNVYPNVVREINTSVTFFRLVTIDVKKILNVLVAVAVRVSAHMKRYAPYQQRSSVIPVTRTLNASQVPTAMMERVRSEL